MESKEMLDLVTEYITGINYITCNKRDCRRDLLNNIFERNSRFYEVCKNFDKEPRNLFLYISEIQNIFLGQDETPNGTRKDEFVTCLLIEKCSKKVKDFINILTRKNSENKIIALEAVLKKLKSKIYKEEYQLFYNSFITLSRLIYIHKKEIDCTTLTQRISRLFSRFFTFRMSRKRKRAVKRSRKGKNRTVKRSRKGKNRTVKRSRKGKKRIGI